MNDTNTSTMGAAPARPTLLTVICIISFIMGAWGVFSGIQRMYANPAEVRAETYATMQAKMKETSAQFNGQAFDSRPIMVDIAEQAAKNVKPIAMNKIILSLITLFGIWQMWNLKKSGFWIYLFSIIGGSVVPFVFVRGGAYAVMAASINENPVIGYLPWILIVFYAINIKQMN